MECYGGTLSKTHVNIMPAEKLICRLYGMICITSSFRMSYRQMTFIIKTFELQMKSCQKFDLLFVNILLEKVNFKV